MKVKNRKKNERRAMWQAANQRMVLKGPATVAFNGVEFQTSGDVEIQYHHEPGRVIRRFRGGTIRPNAIKGTVNCNGGTPNGVAPCSAQ